MRSRLVPFGWLPGLATALGIALMFGVALQPAGPARQQPTPPPAPPAQPTSANPTPRAIVGLSAITVATGGALTQDMVQRYAQSHPIPFEMAGKTGAIIIVVHLPSRDLHTLLQMDMNVPPDTDLWLVEFQGSYIFPGSSQQPDGLRYPNAFEVYFASTGNLLMEGGLLHPVSANPTSGATPTPNPSPAALPTATSVPPTATSVPPTATSVPIVCTLVASGNAQLNVDLPYYDFEAGGSLGTSANKSGSDLHYITGTSNTFTAINGAAIADVGATPPPCTQYLSVGYISGGTVAVKAGEFYMMRTNGGHIALFQVTSYSHDIIQIAWQLFHVS